MKLKFLQLLAEKKEKVTILSDKANTAENATPTLPQLCPGMRTDDFEQEGTTRPSPLTNPNKL